MPSSVAERPMLSVTWPRWAGGFLWRWDSRLQRPSLRAGFPARHPILSASCDDSRKARGGDPISTTASLQSPEMQRAASTSTSTAGEHCIDNALTPLCAPPPQGRPQFEETPERHESLAGYGHNPHPSHARATAPNTFTTPDTAGAVRLEAPPTPRQLCGHPTHMPVARLAHAVFASTRAAVIRRRRDSLLSPPLPDDSCRRASQKIPSPTTTPH